MATVFNETLQMIKKCFCSSSMDYFSTPSADDLDYGQSVFFLQNTAAKCGYF